MKARVGSKSGLRGWLAVIFVSGLALLPILLLLLKSFARVWFWPALWPEQLSLRAWSYLASPVSGVFPALLTSIEIALIVTVIAVAAAIPAARALAFGEFRGKRVLFFLLLLPVLASSLTSAMGVHNLFLRYGLTDSLGGVILVHLIPTVPYATLMLTSSFANFDLDWEAQARTLGASTIAIWRYITLPAIAPGVAVAASFAFLISWSQYLTTLLIGGGTVITLPLVLVSFQRGGDEGIAAALSLILILPALLVFIVVARFLRNG